MKKMTIMIFVMGWTFCTSCGSVQNLSSSEGAGIYGGVAIDYQTMGPQPDHSFIYRMASFYDIPISFSADTLLFPYLLIVSLTRDSSAQDADQSSDQDEPVSKDKDPEQDEPSLPKDQQQDSQSSSGPDVQNEAHTGR